MQFTADKLLDMWNEEVQAAADELIPGYMHGGLRRWITQGIFPGGFLTAILENDLKGACERADTANRDTLFNYVNFLYNYCPSACWGSPAKVAAWAETFVQKENK